MPCASRIHEESGSAAMDADHLEPTTTASSSTNPVYPHIAQLTPVPPASPDADQNVPLKTPKKRRRRPRPPPAQPGLRWLNSTDPSQFRDDRVRKAVRSHVMYDHAARKKSLTTVPPDPVTLVHLCKDSTASSHETALAPARLEEKNTLALSLLDRLASHLDPLGQLPTFPGAKVHVRELQKFCACPFLR